MTREEYFIEARDAFYTLNDLKKYNIPKEVYDNICAQFYALGASYNEQPSLPSNLAEAAEESMPEEEWFLEIDIYGGSEAVYSREQMLAMFKAGAEWMAGQGVSTVAISNIEDGITEEGMKSIADYLESLPDKTEVVLQIRKKQ